VYNYEKSVDCDHLQVSVAVLSMTATPE